MKVFGITGWKDSGKTGLMERLISNLTARGFRVAAVKHAHHSFDVDHPGKDSFRHRAAGATEVLLSSANRWALMAELRGAKEPGLSALLTKLNPADIVLVEGFKADPHPKIECWRAEKDHPLISARDQTILALAGDAVPDGLSIPYLPLDATDQIADFILAELGLTPQAAKETPAHASVRNDCFALPPGVDWVPVGEALDYLKSAIHPVCESETIAATDGVGRILAVDVIAKRSNPPAANSAVDGYGFLHASLGAGPAHKLPLIAGRAAAGAPFDGEVPVGHAIRILTGALVPAGIDTVVLEEDVDLDGDQISFSGQIKPGANTRKAGEDVHEGEVALPAGRQLTVADMALLAALGITELTVRRALRIGVLSTGDELVAPGSATDPAKTYDANRPMLLSLARAWGHQAVDLGHVADERAALRARLDQGADAVDIVLTSGGASAGEEDHVSALLNESGSMALWRIAMKPGRPLALGVWNGVPVFGLPGNPVAAFVCALVFARPAAARLAGAGWADPIGYQVPAGFTKNKKPGRREYLRARINADGQAEAFASEGSGRISGLSWAEGLVELSEGARQIKPGDPVRYIPFGNFGL